MSCRVPCGDVGEGEAAGKVLECLTHTDPRDVDTACRDLAIPWPIPRPIHPPHHIFLQPSCSWQNARCETDLRESLRRHWSHRGSPQLFSPLPPIAFASMPLPLCWPGCGPECHHHAITTDIFYCVGHYTSPPPKRLVRRPGPFGTYPRRLCQLRPGLEKYHLYNSCFPRCTCREGT